VLVLICQIVWLASIVEGGNDAIVGKTVDGIITSWNKGAERLFGCSAQEAIGQPVTSLILLERQREEYALLDSTRRGARIKHFETVRRRKYGSLVEGSLTISPMRGKAGKSSARQKLLALLLSASEARRKRVFSLARLNTEPKNLSAKCAR
jgi:PAS domain S-box-containing protein